MGDPSGTSSTGQATTFGYTLPSLGADMDEGRVIEWRVGIGDTVHRGDLIAIVETEKSDIDIEIWHDGIIEEFLVALGDLIDVGTPIARLRHLDAAAPAPRTQSTPSPETPHALPAPTGKPARVLASPLARRLAAERGIDLATVTGTGPAGAVIEADLDDRAPIPRPTETPRRATPSQRQRSPESMRSMIAERMSRSNQEIPHYYLARDLDVGPMQAWLTGYNAERPITDRLLPAACFVRATALAAARHRELNGFWIDDHFEVADTINVAMIISLRNGGLVAPHIESADKRSLDEIMATLNQLVTAARRGTLRASWMTGSTITITSLGDGGADLVHGVISPPQVALVGFGRSVPRAWVVDELVTTRPIVTTTLAADHRASDGANGSRFLATLADHLTHPETL